jgi:hypothetical protein
MAANELDGFEPTLSRFYVTCSNLAVSRMWCADGDASMRVVIHGAAVADEDDVCVIGTETRSDTFDITITSDINSKAEWELLRANLMGEYKECDTHEYRVTQGKYKRLDKAPATAFLLAPQRGEWDLECKVSPSTLEQLEKDIADGRVRAVTIGIEWVCGFAKERGLRMGPERPLFGKTWGLFRVSEEDPVEDLLGHVELVKWDIIDGNAETRQCEGDVSDGKPGSDTQLVNQQGAAEAMLRGPLDSIARSVRVIMWVVIVVGINWVMR